MKYRLLVAICLAFFGYSNAKGINPKGNYYQLPKNIELDDVYPDIVILKEKTEFRGILNGSPYSASSYLQQAMDIAGVSEIKRRFPNHKALKETTDKYGNPKVDLSLIQEIRINGSTGLLDAINILASTGLFEYVEPKFKQQLLFTPDDPLIGSQYYLDNIQAYSAWDISQGDTNVVIGITDTGIQLNHPDLVNKIKYNWADPINGIDDDGDGYVDNFQGWDTGMNDNDPSTNHSVSHHGIWVSGVAAMETNNTTHGAGIGFNCKLLPVKISTNTGNLSGSYDGIVYAADHGADIINCSWGSANSFSQFGQDIITYATINQNALVVCAAGNSGRDEPFYPASYKYALSVCMTDENDIKVNDGTYHEYVDITAPGANIQTTKQNDGFGDIGTGSSFSSPAVAGCAGLVKSHFPSLNAIQIGELLKVTADDIDALVGNETYAGKMGSGRANIHSALTVSGFPSIVLTSYEFSSNGFNDNDTIDLTGIFTNYLDPSTPALTATLSTNSGFIEILENSSALGTISTLSSANNEASPFRFRIIPGSSANTRIGFNITYSDGSYSGKDYIVIVINPDYLDMDVNDVTATITSKGHIGYNGYNQADGNGINYQGGASHLYEMYFMIAQADNRVSFARDAEFQKSQNIEVILPGRESDKDVLTYYDDSPAAGSSLNVDITQKTLGWNKSGHGAYIITEFNIYNSGGSDLNDIYPALYADWDITNWNNNIAYYSADNHTGLAYEPDGDFTGIKLLTDTNKANFYAFNNDGTGGSHVIYDGFSQVEQHSSASNGVSRSSASLGDIAETIGVGPISIAAGDSARVAFAIIMGNDSVSIYQSGDSAAVQYHRIRHVQMSLSELSNESCLSSNDGSATVAATFGVPPYSYTWNDPLSQNGATANGLSAGDYLVSVTDFVGNKTSINVQVDAPTELTSSIDTVYDALCHGDQISGGAEILASGGNLGYSFNWNDPEIGNTSSPVLGAGNYWVFVSDQNDCIDDTLFFEVNQPDSLMILVNDTIAATHPDTCNGIAVIEAVGGIAPYSYSWNDEFSSDTDSVGTLCADNYLVTVYDANGCVAKKTIEIPLDYEEPVVDPTSVNETISNNLIYPNPTVNLLNIDWKHENGNYEIFDLVGKEVENGLLNKGTNIINLEHLVSGHYFVRMTTASEAKTVKIEVVK